MKLYYSPGACSLGIHVLLEETGQPYALQRLNFAADEQHQPPFLAINPKGKVPTLVRDDGSVLTEFAAIAWWLALTYPQAKLLPEGAERQARALEAMDYVVGTLHAQGFARMFRPTRFTTVEADQDQVKAQGREIFATGMRLLDAALAGKDWVVGSFSVADAALFYVEHWAGRMAIELPANCAAHKARMLARPAVGRAIEQEGIAG
jgi:glutathione S-transferase